MESTFGTDGVKYTDRYGEIWVAWHPEQIKETTNKNPTSNLDVRYSDRDYSYETLTAKPDMKVTLLDNIVPNNRADVVSEAKKNAAKILSDQNQIRETSQDGCEVRSRYA